MKTRILYFGLPLYFMAVFCFGASVNAAERHTDIEPPVPFTDDGVEELVVVGESDETVESRRRAHLDHLKGMSLYESGRYEEALPYLLAAAKRGYKDSQARLAHLYLHGLGGLKRSDKLGIVWMGVAAYGDTKPIIQRRYEQLMSAVPSQHVGTLKTAVEEYVARYGQFEQTVECDVQTQAGTNIAKTRCYFEYEQAVMSAIEVAEMQAFFKDKIIPPDQWSSFQTLDNFRGNINIEPPSPPRSEE